MKIRMLVLSCLVWFGLMACQPEVNHVDSPSEVAAQFFEALYNERDMDRVISLASESHQRLLERYGTPSAVGRYMYNLSYDSVQVSAERPTGAVYGTQADTIRLQVALTGMSQGRRNDSLREVVLIQEDGRWKLDRVLDSPY